jgi:HSP20 family molecular chaperone IbpA
MTEETMSEKRNPGRAAADEPVILPPVDVLEDLAGITVCADLPGVPRERLNVHVEGEVLVIEGDIAVEMPKEMEATHIEVGLPRYRRVFSLSKELDTGRLAAELKHGVLTVRIPKAEHAKPKRIAVEVG